MFYPTWTDIGVFIGTIGIFFAFYLAFARYFPVLAIAELKTIVKISGESYKNGTAPGHDDHGGDDHSGGSAVVAESPASEDAQEEISDDVKSSRVSSLIEKIGSGSAENKNDLKQISGVGPKMEETLNQIGIYSYEQVSKMTDNEYDLLDSITGTFQGRAKRDDWAGQAKELMNK
jgi:molybdopterin-containing oxidoreductase family membrane subunit